MKILLYVAIGIIGLLVLFIGVQLIVPLGACVIAGFFVLVGLEELHIIEAPKDGKVLFTLSLIIGIIIFGIYYGITGLPE